MIMFLIILYWLLLTPADYLDEQFHGVFLFGQLPFIYCLS